MTNKDLYKIWAPFDFPWSAWTRPVLFANINDTLKINKYLSFEPNVVIMLKRLKMILRFLLICQVQKVLKKELHLQSWDIVWYLCIMVRNRRRV